MLGHFGGAFPQAHHILRGEWPSGQLPNLPLAHLFQRRLQLLTLLPPPHIVALVLLNPGLADGGRGRKTHRLPTSGAPYDEASLHIQKSYKNTGR